MEPCRIVLLRTGYYKKTFHGLDDYHMPAPTHLCEQTVNFFYENALIGIIKDLLYGTILYAY